MARNANEQVAAALLGADADVMTVLCECGRAGCQTEITMNRAAYHSISLKGTLLVLRNGHEDTAARVVSRNGAFVIVDGE